LGEVGPRRAWVKATAGAAATRIQIEIRANRPNRIVGEDLIPHSTPTQSELWGHRKGIPEKIDLAI
jgi:hypothetical protein